MRNQTQRTLQGEEMLRLVELPNLPKGRVRLVLAGACYIPRLSLSKWGIEALPIFPYNLLETPLAEHADMQALHLYSNKIVSNPNSLCKLMSLYRGYIRKKTCKVETLVIDFCAGIREDLRQYPESAAYNVLILGKYAVYNPKCIDFSVLSNLKMHYICIPIRQGYARCASCIVSEDAVITADEGIAKALQVLGIDVLRITPGYIELPGYPYGFIGGASFKISQNQLAFTGTLERHPDCVRILCFLEKHGVEPVFLSSDPVFDIGSAAPSFEAVEA